MNAINTMVRGWIIPTQNRMEKDMKKSLTIDDLLKELSFHTNEPPEEWREMLEFLQKRLPNASVVMTCDNVIGAYRKCLEYNGFFYQYGYCDDYGYHSLWENGFNSFGWYGTILEKLPKEFIKSVSYEDNSQKIVKKLGMTQNQK